MNFVRVGIMLAALLGAPAFSQSLVFEGNNLIDRERDENAGESGVGAGLRALQDRNLENTAVHIIRIPRSRDGHFYADVTVNGVGIHFLVDTGASIIALSQKDAQRIGVEPHYLNYSLRAETASGTIKIAPTKLRSMVFGEAENFDFSAYVMDGDAVISLLGMSYLSTFSQIEITNEFMILHP